MQRSCTSGKMNIMVTLEDDNKKCPQCGLKAGELDETHSWLNLKYYECAFCHYYWQEVIDIPDIREER
jgi:predicted RNA-binding Zn-ribbon protein involved in translation (DUF1610 family)